MDRLKSLGAGCAALVLLLSIQATAYAADDCPCPATQVANAQLLVWLKTAQYAKLDAYYANVQKQFSAGAVDDEALYQAFHDLYDDRVENEAKYDAWIAAFPKSYVARVARGSYFYRMAWAVRGGRYISKTSDSQIEAMTTYLKRSTPDLMASMQLDPKPYLSVLYLMNVNEMVGSPLDNRRLLDIGNQIDPTNVRLRARYMRALTPKWGGSLPQMQAFLQECKGKHLPADQIAGLEDIIRKEGR